MARRRDFSSVNDAIERGRDAPPPQTSTAPMVRRPPGARFRVIAVTEVYRGVEDYGREYLRAGLRGEPTQEEEDLALYGAAGLARDEGIQRLGSSGGSRMLCAQRQDENSGLA
jgi:hypothetical protein